MTTAGDDDGDIRHAARRLADRSAGKQQPEPLSLRPTTQRRWMSPEVQAVGYTVQALCALLVLTVYGTEVPIIWWVLLVGGVVCGGLAWRQVLQQRRR